MKILANKKIILGVTGGIAAYKSAILTRQLIELGVNVRVVMTESAQAFITPLTFQALSGNPVSLDLLDESAEAAMGHIELAKWADLILIAPASANFIARLANGLADDLLTTLCIATQAPIAVAPAMNQQMWAARPTQRNLNLIREDKRIILGPATGQQACGDVGLGRMLEPEQICQLLPQIFAPQILRNKHLVITAGPTREPLDPVRYISNHSSGKMGYALAQAALAYGAQVTLVSGPCDLPCPQGAKRIMVESAEQMLAACQQNITGDNIFIACAAVADYQYSQPAQQKIKKQQAELTLTFTRNPDILATIAKQKERPFCVGFAAETQHVESYARGKLNSKNLDMIVANDVSDPTIGFNSNQNAVTLLWHDGQQSFSAADKLDLSYELLTIINQHYEKKHSIKNS
ncbi:bifunctional phosphopantothenoylcysteine decarboxylase/phosphopantothenate--cysteine ligase CoaBC [Gayadomonas joobiniege]|uniref:bifunctional phosphopantothenoylcysteine decarboxylase/phosphopantothenate--cysteine ligase CoaBC n=1 Tax=Gayadomonas joobiniege TaxID=1234606 RepID=UPI0003676817|nr:bifunctional phosphopantothenoylcysteine decarboxylase/phosphopantothenate--cysteine ligase CoaBC [Gayadomonas joobiniege]